MGNKFLGLLAFLVALPTTYFLSKLVPMFFFLLMPDEIDDGDRLIWATLIGGLQVAAWVVMMVVCARLVRQKLYRGPN
jgi:hypothetical protein